MPVLIDFLTGMGFCTIKALTAALALQNERKQNLNLQDKARLRRNYQVRSL